MENLTLLNILWVLVGAMATIILGLLGWFLNKVWSRQDSHEERIAKMESAMVTLAEIFKKQEDFQEKVLEKLLNKGF